MSIVFPGQKTARPVYAPQWHAPAFMYQKVQKYTQYARGFPGYFYVFETRIQTRKAWGTRKIRKLIIPKSFTAVQRIAKSCQDKKYIFENITGISWDNMGHMQWRNQEKKRGRRKRHDMLRKIPRRGNYADT